MSDTTICFLTKTQGVYDLPVAKVFTVPQLGFIAPDSTSMTQQDIDNRPLVVLQSHGVLKFKELSFNNKYEVKTGFVDEITDWGVVRTPTVEDISDLTELSNSVRAAIINEAERRIDAGLIWNGITFKADTRSVSRVHGMLKAAEEKEANNESYTAEFMTSAGKKVSVTLAAQIKSLYLAVEAHVNATLKRSASLQLQVIGDSDLIEPMTLAKLKLFDPIDDTNWI